ncbi:MAG: YchJ family protein [Deltaproteobacteria bacterium]|nr:YchJ family protein [Deltaproteobacteria bacterium]
MSCECGLGPSTQACCGPYLSGEKKVPTAAALMRSRYTAYATGAIDYLVSSHHPDTVGEMDRKATTQWSRQSEWQGIEIVSTEAGGEGDESGIVEFKAFYRIAGRDVVHHERAEFRKHNGTWKFYDGLQVKPPPVRVAPKPGRNDPCSCGSGKKYKKCCGA